MHMYTHIHTYTHTHTHLVIIPCSRPVLVGTHLEDARHNPGFGATNKGVTGEGGISCFSIFPFSGISGLWGHLESITEFEDFGRYRIFQKNILTMQNGHLKDPISLEILKITNRPQIAPESRNPRN